MVHRIWPLLLLAAAGGCFADDQTALVPDRPLAAPPAPPLVQTNFAPATTEVAARVDGLGRHLLAANREQLGVRPLFRTVGAPQPEIFHRNTAEIYVSEGLVKQCKSDAQLAALLCLELGKMVAEREALAGPRARQTNQEPPPNVPVGNDNGGFFGPPDLTRQAELAKYKPPARREPPPTPPDPEVLARNYLQKAGFAPAELDGALPLLKVGNGSATLEKQLLVPPAAPPQWTK